MAGNQLGKTLAGAAEVAMHLTGRYPDWWEGKRFDHPVVWLAGSETGELTRDGVQRLLVGPPDREDDWGTAMVPGDCLVDWSRAMGVPNALDSITVKHINGGNSTLYFKTYAQGRKKWQANTVHGVWFDEEPPMDVYSEGVTRTNVHLGPVFLTFTPLLGMSAVVLRFLQPADDDAGAQDRKVITMTIDEALHYSEEQRRKIIDSYPEHEKEARARGVPILGSGAIFPISDESITCDPFKIPNHWFRLGGVDFGYDHPFGATEIVWDKDTDTIYITKEYREPKKTPIIHAAALKPWSGATQWMPFAWPHDGLQHDKGSGEELAKQYRDQGLNMLLERATFEDGGNGVEAGLFEMLDRMQTGRLKVFSTCTKWMEEKRLYHRKEGKVVKLMDDLISSTRYAIMMKRRAIQPANAYVAEGHRYETDYSTF